MAQYSVVYSCGHEGSVSLFGKHSERERKLDWFSRQGKCTACFKAEKEKDALTKPITLSVNASGFKVDLESGMPLIQIVLTGGTKAKRETIKELGYVWGEVDVGIVGFLSMDSPEWAWIKNLEYSEDHIACIVNQTCQALDLDAPKIAIDPITMIMIADQVKKAEQAQKEIEALEKPKRPDCHPCSRHPEAKKNGAWNGKYYGQKGSRNYYVNGVRYAMKDNEYDDCMTYRAAISEYNSKVRLIKEKLKN